MFALFLYSVIIKTHMLLNVYTPVKKLADYKKYITKKQFKEIETLAKELKGLRLNMINATPRGGGVAEILKSLIPLMKGAGIKARWYAIDSSSVPERFLVLADKIRYASQGKAIKISKKDWRYYKKISEKFARETANKDCDLLLIHDWQPMFMADYLKKEIPKILHYHADTLTPYRPVWKEILKGMEPYRCVLFNNRDFINKEMPKEKTRVFHGAIDPLALKQKVVCQKKARKYLQPFGFSLKDPLLVQVSRFDIWKNPIGLIEAFRLVQKKHPKAQLALVGIEEATDNLAAKDAFEEAKAAAKDIPNVLFFFSQKNIKNIEEFTMMAQNAADIIIQNSVREGFGLTVSEAMWKEKPVIGGPASGIRLQIQDRKNGFIVKNSKQLAARINFLLACPKKRKALGKKAKETVREKFLMSRLLIDHLRLYKEILSA